MVMHTPNTKLGVLVAMWEWEVDTKEVITNKVAILAIMQDLQDQCNSLGLLAAMWEHLIMELVKEEG